MPASIDHPLNGPGTAPQIHPAAVAIMTQIRRWTIPDEQQPVNAVLSTQQFLIGFPPVGSGVITTGIWGGAPIDFPCRITRVKIRAWDVAPGSIVIDILKAPDGTSDFASIVGGTPPTITASTIPYIDNALIGWNTAINRSDDLRFDVSSVSDFSLVTISLRLRRLDLEAPA